MGVTAVTGPFYTYGAAQGDNNGQQGPNLFFQGSGILDPRAPYTYQPGQRADQPTYGWLGTTNIPVISQVPSTLAVNNIAASAIPVAGTAFTLVSVTGAGITAGVSITRADTGATVTGLLAIDGAMGGVAFGQGTGSGGPTRIWDPTKAISRAVRVVSASDDSGGTFRISGYDIYGYPMTQLLTGASGAPGTATTTKAFKYIASVLPAGTLGGGAITIGTTDVIGLPLMSTFFGDLRIMMNNAIVTASTGYVAGVATSPSTNLLGDVRGTYALQTPSNNTLRLMIQQTPPVANIGTTAGLLGVTQV